MRIRASFFTILSFGKVATVLTAATLAGCGGAAKTAIYADTPALPYQAPDVDEITGIETPDDEATPPAGTGSAQNPQK